MRTPDPIVAMSKGWNRDPAGTALGTARSGVSAALWTHDSDDVQEVFGDPDASNHLVAWQLNRFSSETFNDDKLIYAGPHAPGTCNLIAAGVRPRAVITGAFRVLHAFLPVKALEHAVSECVDTDLRRLELIDPRCSHDPVMERLGRELLIEMGTDRPLTCLRVDALGLELAVQLIRAHSNLACAAHPGSMKIGGLAPWQQRRATDFLQAHLADDVSLQAMADTAQLSAFHFARQFKRSTGLPPHAYQRRLRCERAKELLLATDLPIGEIAAQVGYETPQAFARMFRSETGASPSEYRRERRS